jgi:hypothetical protein
MHLSQCLSHDPPTAGGHLMPTDPRNPDERLRALDADDDDEDVDAEDALEEGAFEPEEYDALLRLERLESVEEEMMELGVTSLEEVRQRIAELHRELDERER